MRTPFRRLLQLAALSAAMLLPASYAQAGDNTTKTETRTTVQVQSVNPDTAAIFDDLKPIEDPKLDSQRAGYYHYHHHGLSGGEILLCVLLLIFIFPVGLIVTIVLVLTD